MNQRLIVLLGIFAGTFANAEVTVPVASGKPQERTDSLDSISFSADPLDDMSRFRDPFKRPDIVAEAESIRGELERFPLDGLKLVGVISGPKQFKAMFLAPDGKTYFASEGAKIGTRNGVIQKIGNGSVIVREKLVNVLGRQEEVQVVVRLEQKNKAQGKVGTISGATPVKDDPSSANTDVE